MSMNYYADVERLRNAPVVDDNLRFATASAVVDTELAALVG